MNSGTQFFGPFRLEGGHFLAHQFGGVDNVKPLALDDLKRNGGIAVKARSAGAILIGEANLRQITQGHNAITIYLDRQIINVLRAFKRGWNTHRQGTRWGVDHACRDQLVVVHNRRNQFLRRDIIGL